MRVWKHRRVLENNESRTSSKGKCFMRTMISSTSIIGAIMVFHGKVVSSFIINNKEFQPVSHDSICSSSIVSNYHADRNRCMPVLYGWKDLFEGAFANDSNLSSDKSLQQLEYDDEDNNENNPAKRPPQELTEVQKRWWASQQQQQQQKSNSPVAAAAGAATPTIQMDYTCWKIDMYLTGIPNFDPNNSLYGAKVNISNRDRQDEQAGFALGTTNSPSSETPPTTSVTLQFRDNGTCFILPGSAFTTPMIEDGEQQPSEQQGTWQWMPSDNNSNNDRLNTMMFTIPCEGYVRTVTTRGTIQNVAWSNREEASTKASATYSIPKGMIYGQIKVDYGSTPGSLTMININNKKQSFGLLYVQEKVGLLGITTKMTPCGKFTGTMLTEEEAK